MQEKLAFIGAGNMACALIVALLKNGYPPTNINVSNPSPEKLQKLREKAPIYTTPENIQAAENADIILLCVKPQKLQLVCEELKEMILQKKPLVISIAAGTPIHFFEKIFEPTLGIIRCMPNVPALVGAGATAICCNSNINHHQRDVVENIFRAFGIIAWVNENEMDAMTALFGSGPAYLFLVMEIFQRIAKEFGISEKTAKLFTLQTVLGSAKLALETDHPFSQLRESVTSPKGTTAAALEVFEKENLGEIFRKALAAAKNRAKELSGQT